ncbi:MAG: TIGR04086 family membrane protein [Candidatus Omnitrophica bacterium]|nr:TIGR04086 family membrane protein [Candidatus Omnitrophota bacterium]
MVHQISESLRPVTDSLGIGTDVRKRNSLAALIMHEIRVLHAAGIITGQIQIKIVENMATPAYYADGIIYISADVLRGDILKLNEIMTFIDFVSAHEFGHVKTARESDNIWADLNRFMRMTVARRARLLRAMQKQAAALGIDVTSHPYYQMLEEAHALALKRAAEKNINEGRSEIEVWQMVLRFSDGIFSDTQLTRLHECVRLATWRHSREVHQKYMTERQAELQAAAAITSPYAMPAATSTRIQEAMVKYRSYLTGGKGKGLRGRGARRVATPARRAELLAEAERGLVNAVNAALTEIEALPAHERPGAYRALFAMIAGNRKEQVRARGVVYERIGKMVDPNELSKLSELEALHQLDHAQLMLDILNPLLDTTHAVQYQRDSASISALQSHITGHEALAREHRARATRVAIRIMTQMAPAQAAHLRDEDFALWASLRYGDGEQVVRDTERELHELSDGTTNRTLVLWQNEREQLKRDSRGLLELAEALALRAKEADDLLEADRILDSVQGQNAGVSHGKALVRQVYQNMLEDARASTTGESRDIMDLDHATAEDIARSDYTDDQFRQWIYFRMTRTGYERALGAIEIVRAVILRTIRHPGAMQEHRKAMNDLATQALNNVDVQDPDIVTLILNAREHLKREMDKYRPESERGPPHVPESELMPWEGKNSIFVQIHARCSAYSALQDDRIELAHDAEDLPIAMYKSKIPVYDHVSGTMKSVTEVRAIEDVGHYQDLGFSLEEAEARAELAKIYNESIVYYERLTEGRFHVATRKGVTQGIAIANLMFRPNLLHKIPTGVGKTTTIFNCLGFAHDRIGSRIEQLSRSAKDADRAKAELLKELYQKSDGKLVFALPDATLLSQTVEDVQTLRKGGIKIAVLTEETLDRIRHGDTDVWKEFREAQIILALGVGVDFLRLDEESFMRRYDRGTNLEGQNIHEFYKLVFSGSRFLWDEYDTCHEQPGTQKTENESQRGDRTLGSNGKTYEVDDTSLVDEVILDQEIEWKGKKVKIRDLDSEDQLAAQRSLLTLTVWFGESQEVKTMSFEQYEKDQSRGLVIDARINAQTVAGAAILRKLALAANLEGITEANADVAFELFTTDMDKFEERLQKRSAEERDRIKMLRGSLVGRAQALRQRDGQVGRYQEAVVRDIDDPAFPTADDIGDSLDEVEIQRNGRTIKIKQLKGKEKYQAQLEYLRGMAEGQFSGKDELKEDLRQLLIAFSYDPDMIRALALGTIMTAEQRKKLNDNPDLAARYNRLSANKLHHLLLSYKLRWSIKVVSGNTIAPRLQMSDPFLNAHTQLVFLRYHKLKVIEPSAADEHVETPSLQEEAQVKRFLGTVTLSDNAVHSTRELTVAGIRDMGSTQGGFTGTLDHVRDAASVLYASDSLDYSNANPYFARLAADTSILTRAERDAANLIFKSLYDTNGRVDRDQLQDLMANGFKSRVWKTLDKDVKKAFILLDSNGNVNLLLMYLSSLAAAQLTNNEREAATILLRELSDKSGRVDRDRVRDIVQHGRQAEGWNDLTDEGKAKFDLLADETGHPGQNKLALLLDLDLIESERPILQEHIHAAKSFDAASQKMQDMIIDAAMQTEESHRIPFNVILNGLSEGSEDESRVIDRLKEVTRQTAKATSKRTRIQTFIYATLETGVWMKYSVDTETGEVIASDERMTLQQVRLYLEETSKRNATMGKTLNNGRDDEHVMIYFNKATIRGVDVFIPANVNIHALADSASKGHEMVQLFGRDRGVRISKAAVMRNLERKMPDGKKNARALAIVKAIVDRAKAKKLIVDGQFSDVWKALDPKAQQAFMRIQDHDCHTLLLDFIDNPDSVKMSEEDKDDAWIVLRELSLSKGDDRPADVFARTPEYARLFYQGEMTQEKIIAELLKDLEKPGSGNYTFDSEDASGNSFRQLYHPIQVHFVDGKIENDEDLTPSRLERIFTGNTEYQGKRAVYEGAMHSFEGALQLQLSELVEHEQNDAAKASLSGWLGKLREYLEPDAELRNSVGEHAYDSLKNRIKHGLDFYRRIAASAEFKLYSAETQRAILAQIDSLEKNLGEFLKNPRRSLRYRMASGVWARVEIEQKPQTLVERDAAQPVLSSLNKAQQDDALTVLKALTNKFGQVNRRKVRNLVMNWEKPEKADCWSELSDEERKAFQRIAKVAYVLNSLDLSISWQVVATPDTDADMVHVGDSVVFTSQVDAQILTKNHGRVEASEMGVALARNPAEALILINQRVRSNQLPEVAPYGGPREGKYTRRQNFTEKVKEQASGKSDMATEAHPETIQSREQVETPGELMDVMHTWLAEQGEITGRDMLGEDGEATIDVFLRFRDGVIKDRAQAYQTFKRLHDQHLISDDMWTEVSAALDPARVADGVFNSAPEQAGFQLLMWKLFTHLMERKVLPVTLLTDLNGRQSQNLMDVLTTVARHIEESKPHLATEITAEDVHQALGEGLENGEVALMSMIHERIVRDSVPWWRKIFGRPAPSASEQYYQTYDRDFGWKIKKYREMKLARARFAEFQRDMQLLQRDIRSLVGKGWLEGIKLWFKNTRMYKWWLNGTQNGSKWAGLAGFAFKNLPMGILSTLFMFLMGWWAIPVIGILALMWYQRHRLVNWYNYVMGKIWKRLCKTPSIDNLKWQRDRVMKKMDKLQRKIEAYYKWRQNSDALHLFEDADQRVSQTAEDRWTQVAMHMAERLWDMYGRDSKKSHDTFVQEAKEFFLVQLRAEDGRASDIHLQKRLRDRFAKKSLREIIDLKLIDGFHKRKTFMHAPCENVGDNGECLDGKEPNQPERGSLSDARLTAMIDADLRANRVPTNSVVRLWHRYREYAKVRHPLISYVLTQHGAIVAGVVIGLIVLGIAAIALPALLGAFAITWATFLESLIAAFATTSGKIWIGICLTSLTGSAATLGWKKGWMGASACLGLASLVFSPILLVGAFGGILGWAVFDTGKNEEWGKGDWPWYLRWMPKTIARRYLHKLIREGNDADRMIAFELLDRMDRVQAGEHIKVKNADGKEHDLTMSELLGIIRDHVKERYDAAQKRIRASQDGKVSKRKNQDKVAEILAEDLDESIDGKEQQFTLRSGSYLSAGYYTAPSAAGAQPGAGDEDKEKEELWHEDQRFQVGSVKKQEVTIRKYRIPGVGAITVYVESENQGRIISCDEGNEGLIGRQVTMAEGKITVQGIEYQANPNEDKGVISIYAVRGFNTKGDVQIYTYRDPKTKRVYIFQSDNGRGVGSRVRAFERHERTVMERLYSGRLSRNATDKLAEINGFVPDGARERLTQSTDAIDQANAAHLGLALHVDFMTRLRAMDPHLANLYRARMIVDESTMDDKGKRETPDEEQIKEIAAKAGVAVEDVYVMLGVSPEVYRSLMKARETLKAQFETSANELEQEIQGLEARRADPASGLTPEQRTALDKDIEFKKLKLEYYLKTLDGLKEIKFAIDPKLDTEALVRGDGTMYWSSQTITQLNLLRSHPSVRSPEDGEKLVQAYMQVFMVHETIEHSINVSKPVLQDMIHETELQGDQSDWEDLSRLEQLISTTGKDDEGKAVRDFACELTATTMMARLMPPETRRAAVKALRIMGGVKGQDNMALKADFYERRALLKEDAWDRFVRGDKTQGDQYAFDLVQNYFRGTFIGFYYNIYDAISQGRFQHARKIIEEKYNEARGDTGEKPISDEEYKRLMTLIMAGERGNANFAISYARQARERLSHDTHNLLKLLAQRETKAQREARMSRETEAAAINRETMARRIATAQDFGAKGIDFDQAFKEGVFRDDVIDGTMGEGTADQLNRQLEEFALEETDRINGERLARKRIASRVARGNQVSVNDLFRKDALRQAYESALASRLTAETAEVLQQMQAAKLATAQELAKNRTIGKAIQDVEESDNLKTLGVEYDPITHRDILEKGFEDSKIEYVPSIIDPVLGAGTADKLNRDLHRRLAEMAAERGITRSDTRTNKELVEALIKHDAQVIVREARKREVDAKVRARDISLAQAELAATFGDFSDKAKRQQFVDQANTYSEGDLSYEGQTEPPKPQKKYDLKEDDLIGTRIRVIDLNGAGLTPDQRAARIRILRRIYGVHIDESMTQIAVLEVPRSRWEYFQKKAGGHEGAAAFADGPERFAKGTLLGRSGIVVAPEMEAKEFLEILGHEIGHTADPLEQTMYREYVESQGGKLEAGWFAIPEMRREILGYLGQHADEIIANPEAGFDEFRRVMLAHYQDESAGNYLSEYYKKQGIPEDEWPDLRKRHLRVLRDMLDSVWSILSSYRDLRITLNVIRRTVTPEELAEEAKAALTNNRSVYADEIIQEAGMLDEWIQTFDMASFEFAGNAQSSKRRLIKLYKTVIANGGEVKTNEGSLKANDVLRMLNILMQRIMDEGTRDDQFDILAAIAEIDDKDCLPLKNLAIMKLREMAEAAQRSGQDRDEIAQQLIAENTEVAEMLHAQGIDFEAIYIDGRFHEDILDAVLGQPGSGDALNRILDARCRQAMPLRKYIQDRLTKRLEEKAKAYNPFDDEQGQKLNLLLKIIAAVLPAIADDEEGRRKYEMRVVKEGLFDRLIQQAQQIGKPKDRKELRRETAQAAIASFIGDDQKRRKLFEGLKFEDIFDEETGRFKVEKLGDTASELNKILTGKMKAAEDEQKGRDEQMAREATKILAVVLYCTDPRAFDIGKQDLDSDGHIAILAQMALFEAGARDASTENPLVHELNDQYLGVKGKANLDDVIKDTIAFAEERARLERERKAKQEAAQKSLEAEENKLKADIQRFNEQVQIYLAERQSGVLTPETIARQNEIFANDQDKLRKRQAAFAQKARALMEPIESEYQQGMTELLKRQEKTKALYRNDEERRFAGRYLAELGARPTMAQIEQMRKLNLDMAITVLRDPKTGEERIFATIGIVPEQAELYGKDNIEAFYYSRAAEVTTHEAPIMPLRRLGDPLRDFDRTGQLAAGKYGYLCTVHGVTRVSRVKGVARDLPIDMTGSLEELSATAVKTHAFNALSYDKGDVQMLIEYRPSAWFGLKSDVQIDGFMQTTPAARSELRAPKTMAEMEIEKTLCGMNVFPENSIAAMVRTIYQLQQTGDPQRRAEILAKGAAELGMDLHVLPDSFQAFLDKTKLEFALPEQDPNLATNHFGYAVPDQARIVLNRQKVTNGYGDERFSKFYKEQAVELFEHLVRIMVVLNHETDHMGMTTLGVDHLSQEHAGYERNMELLTGIESIVMTQSPELAKRSEFFRQLPAKRRFLQGLLKLAFDPSVLMDASERTHFQRILMGAEKLGPEDLTLATKLDYTVIAVGDATYQAMPGAEEIIYVPNFAMLNQLLAKTKNRDHTVVLMKRSLMGEQYQPPGEKATGIIEWLNKQKVGTFIYDDNYTARSEDRVYQYKPEDVANLGKVAAYLGRDEFKTMMAHDFQLGGIGEEGYYEVGQLFFEQSFMRLITDMASSKMLGMAA